LSIGFKLNGDNYPLTHEESYWWQRKKSHLTGIPLAPEEIKPTHEKWEKAD